MYRMHWGCLLLAILFSTAASTVVEEDQPPPSPSSPLISFLLIPVFAALVGYGTNWLAIQMTFYPIHFSPAPFKLWQPRGQPWGLFGWQGIIPAKAGHMAGVLVELITTKLMNVHDVFARIDPTVVAKLLATPLQASTRRAVDIVAQDLAPAVWGGCTPAMREEITLRAGGDATILVQRIMGSLQERILDVFDLKHLAVSRAEANKEIVVHMFQSVGAPEFKFIINSGFYFGFLFGIFQAIQFYLLPVWWSLPLLGFVNGFATNYLALFLIFRPLRPTTVCGITYQGAFLRRQAQVAAEFSKVAVHHFLTGSHIWNEILTGRHHARFESLLRSASDSYCDQVAIGASGQAALHMVLGAEAYPRLKRIISDVMVEEFPHNVKFAYDYMEDAMGIETTLRESLTALPPEEFEGVLHPVFQEDELKLIMVGGILGGAVGLLQVLTVFNN